jgi:putative Mn2+ efflux pump MntP
MRGIAFALLVVGISIDGLVVGISGGPKTTSQTSYLVVTHTIMSVACVVCIAMGW